jgi:uncharacterized RDD family membrane protein YckC
MDSIKVQTAQNVEIEYEIAGVGDRILAYLLDVLFVFAYFMVVIALFSIFALNEVTKFIAPYIFIFFLPAFLYDFLCESFMNGQSPGKKLLKIKVVRLDGTQPTIGNYFLRWLLHFVDITFTYGSVALITILINGKGQRLGDLAAHTSVIKLVKRAHLSDTIFANVEENYKVVFPQAAVLDDRTIEIAKEVLNTFIEEDRHGLVRNNLAQKTQKAIEKKLGLSAGMDARPFLQTIIKDFNYLKGRI